ncbi:hypothetical protein [Comamonas endophytica]|uniref:DUF2946 family protein n=1 Tax=Comamonas endophytica TaxID=2949090 RepID=A0ABY6GB30_9BURK|nr:MULTISPECIES: hypothetical protein [unclassified Acidovorax]MCD2511871.1 hypothetical protein [Acidovorax sp. D4N7]UYG51592.1 hypothetical protein M9799_16310 [Acidovorax sp. 5MLIR]
MTLSAPRPHRARLLLCWLALAMLLAPALGRIHQVVHPAKWQGAGMHVHAVAAAAIQADPGRDLAGHWLLALFSGHGHSDCQLHDQLNAWAGPPSAGAPLPQGLPRELPCHVEGRTASAGSAAFFDPRAPPAAAV